MSITFTTGAIVQQKRLVKMSGAAVIHNTATATDDPIGVSAFYGASGDVISVQGLSGEEPVEVTAAGAFSAGVSLYAAADGKVQALPSASGTYRRVGKSAEAATADGDIVLMIPLNDGSTATV